MSQNLGDSIFIRIADEQAARLSPDFAETLATLTHGWRIHQWKHLFRIANQEGVEKSLIGVLQITEKDVFMERGWLPRQCLQPTINLFIETPDVRWKQAVQVEYVPFVIEKRRSFIESGRIY